VSFISSISLADHRLLTANGVSRNLFGQEYCQGRKRVSKKEVKEAFEALTDEKKAVRFCLLSIQLSNDVLISTGICKAT